jgi:glycosyltransferase involved in cell wall biosynthesis
VGWGFNPWRRGGLIAYAEDLMAAQVERGHEVAYFFSGRHYPLRSGPRLKRWTRNGIQMHEAINGPIVSGLELGTRWPDRDVSEPWLEEAFRSVIRSARSDLVHIQELLCLPSSLIDVAAEEGVATVMTLQDYLPLCSTLRLFDADGRRCDRLSVGDDCEVRNAGAPATRAPFVADTLNFEVRRWQRRLRIGSPSFYDRVAARLRDWGVRQVGSEPPPPVLSGDALATAFQRRRDVNVERLGRVGRLVAQSPRVAEIYRERGVSGEQMITLPFTLAHIERLRPRARAAPPRPVTFATLGGCASLTKGSMVVLGALRDLRAKGLEGEFRLRVLGGIDGDIRAELGSYRGVELDELYERENLDAILDAVDVGIIPSIWEEAFGYVGLEMLAKGIPLIANPLGGIVEYAREGETAWLNLSCTGEGLADLMSKLIAEPALVVDMSRRVRDRRSELVTPMADHVDAIEGVYRELG